MQKKTKKNFSVLESLCIFAIGYDNEKGMVDILLLEEAERFIYNLQPKARLKIIRTLDFVKNGQVDKRLFKKLVGTDIWEFRTEYEGNAYRMLSFWDPRKKSLVVATHGFVKKTQKTPLKEILKAENIRIEYLKGK